MDMTAFLFAGWRPRSGDRSAAPVARLIGLAFTGALLIAAVVHFDRVDFKAMGKLIPADPVFWITYCTYYLVGPIIDLIIYQRIWPGISGLFPALLRKLVTNELVIGLAGDTALYAWACEKKLDNPSPLRAIKDVAVLSGLVGNLATLVIAIAASSWLRNANATARDLTLAWSAAAVIAPTLLVLIFHNRIISLPSRERWIIAAWHLLRIASQVLLLALLWRLLLPEIPAIWLLPLAALRMLVSRLPFTPNLDVTFAALAVVVAGPHNQITMVMVAMAAVTLLTHLSIAVLIAVGHGTAIWRNR